ncbi:hypothetical protein [Bradyrhizobium sp. STM 3562]|uniref:hypothetical protein n=1 Tax=Bradyrhizobium sp. STM 3562 TaxID=578924 RepID=UPI00388F6894
MTTVERKRIRASLLAGEISNDVVAVPVGHALEYAHGGAGHHMSRSKIQALSVSAFQSHCAVDRNACEYLKPGTLPALRFRMPNRFGPKRLESSLATV